MMTTESTPTMHAASRGLAKQRDTRKPKGSEIAPAYVVISRDSVAGEWCFEVVDTDVLYSSGDVLKTVAHHDADIGFRRVREFLEERGRA